MGNCSLKGAATNGVSLKKIPKSFRVMTESGNILELEGPKHAGEVLRDYPGQGIFGKGHFSSPLLDDDELHGGGFYYMLPLGKGPEAVRISTSAEMVNDYLTCKGSAVEVLPPPRKGVWSVKLVINTKQLEEILSEDVNTEALIEQMRLAAANSTNVTPRRHKMIIGWGSNWKPMFSSVFKGTAADQRIPHPESPCGTTTASSPNHGVAANEVLLAT